MLTRGTSFGEKWKNRKNSRDFWYILGIPLRLRLFDLFLLSRNVGMFLSERMEKDPSILKFFYLIN